MLEAQLKTCQNCKAEFRIEPEDFDFYKRIKVPPPTFCADCRAARRMSWRNMWHLYKRPDARTGELIFSSFPPDAPVKTYERDYWWSDAWDPTAYGKEIDWSRPFIQQLVELMREVPLPANSAVNNVRCDYCTNLNSCKDCYLVRAAAHTEDSAYLIWDESSRQCMDSHMTDHCQLSYGNVNASRCYKTLFSVNCEDCQDVILSKDCTGCSNCFGCVGLRGKSYHIFNAPYTKEEYAKKLQEMNLGSWKSFEQLKQQVHEVWLKFPVKYMQGLQNSGVSGDYIYNSKNTHHSYRVRDAENSRFCMNMLSGPVKDCYDYSNWGQGSELLYEALVCGNQTYNVKFTWNGHTGNSNVEYCFFCHSSSNLFGCVGIKKGEYLILNKQYSEEEYKRLVPKLIEHMNAMPYIDTKGNVYKYGEFFPSELSPFPYNISEAQELFPKTEEEAKASGLAWKKEERTIHQATVQASALPDGVKEADDTLLKEIVGCVHEGSCEHECTGAFRIVPQELQFLKQLGIPLPRLCPNCRHYERLKWRNLPRFHDRSCQCAGTTSEGGEYRNSAPHSHGEMHCETTFKTSYTPDRPEIVYCEQCYQAEVT